MPSIEGWAEYCLILGRRQVRRKGEVECWGILDAYRRNGGVIEWRCSGTNRKAGGHHALTLTLLVDDDSNYRRVVYEMMKESSHDENRIEASAMF